jgi:hypothetical protein
MQNTITETTQLVCVLKANAKLPRVLAYIKWAFTENEMHIYDDAFNYIFPRALYKHFYNTRKVDKQQLKRLIRDKDVMRFLLREVDCFFNNVDLLIKLHHYCDSNLSIKDSRKIIKNLFPPPAKELGGIGNNTSLLQSFLNVGMDEDTRETIESLQDSINSRIPTTTQQIDMLQQLCQASAGVSGSFDGLNGTLTALVDSFTKAAKKTTDFTSNIKETINGFNILPKLLASSAVAYAAYVLATDMTKTNIALATVAVGYAVYTIGIDNIKDLFKDCGVHIFALISKILGRATTNEVSSMYQGCLDDFSFLTSIFSSWPKATLSSLTNLMRISKDLPGFLSGLLDIIKDALDAGTSNYFGFNTMNSMFNATDALNVKFNTLLKEHEQRKLLINIENSIRVDFLINEYEKVLIKLDGKQRFNVSRLISTKLAVLRKIQAHFHVFMAVDKSFRQEPTTLCVRGPPGIYKTELSAQLVDIALRLSLPTEEVNNSERHNLVYERKSTQEFWSNYPPTCEVITMDDFGQQREAVGSTTSCYLDLIYIYNTAPFMLNCATLEEKGNVFCNAKWAVLTTNCLEFKPYSLVDRNAVTRRIDFMIEPIPKPAYALANNINVLDPTLIRTETEGVLDITLDKFDFKVIRNGKDNTMKMMSFEQLIDALALSHVTKTARFKQNAKRRARMTRVVSKQIEQRDALLRNADDYTRNHALNIPDTKSFVQADFSADDDEEEYLKHDFDIFDSMDKAFMEEVEDFTCHTKDKAKTGINFGYIHDDRKKLDVRINRVVETLKVQGLMNGQQAHIDSSEIIRIYGDIEKMVSTRAHAILLKHIDEKWLLYYTLCYHLYTFEYKVLTDDEVHPLFAGMTPFMFFLLLANKKSEFGEYLFRGYEFKQCEIENITLIVSFNVPMMDSIKDFMMKKSASFLEYMSTLPSYVQTVFFFGAGYVVYRTYIVMIKGTIALFQSAYDFLIRLIGGGEEQSSQPRYSKLSKSEKINLRDLINTQGNDLSGYDMAKKISCTNTSSYIVEYRAEGHRDSFKILEMGSVLWLDSTTLLLPEHYITMCLAKFGKEPENLSNMWISLANEDGTTIYEEPVATILASIYHTYDGDAHLILWKIPKPLGQLRKNIREYFVKDSDVHSLSNDDLNVTICINSDNKAFQNSSATVTSVAIGDIKLAKGLEYSIDTGKGDCGMPLFVRQARLGKRRLIGIHIGGTEKGHFAKYAWSALVTQEMIGKYEAALDLLLLENNKNIFEFDENDVTLQAGVSLNNLVPYSHSPYKKSKIVPSILAKHLPASTKHPALLMRKGNIDPYAVARANYYKRDTFYNDSLAVKAKKDLIDYLVSKSWTIDTELVTVEEALYGSVANPLYSAIPSGTSAGAPIKYVQPDLKNKLLGPAALRSRANKTFIIYEKDIHERVRQANEGHRLKYLYTDNLKDTLVSAEKFEAGKGRLFSGSCMNLCVCTKIVFGKAMEFFAKDSITKGFATTLNPYSSDWHKVAYNLSRFAPAISECVVLCMDYSKFDASHTQQTLHEALDVINEWYRFHGFTRYETARNTLFKEITNSIHLVFNEEEEWDGSLPSGSMLTLLVNGIINHLNLRYCYYRLVPDVITSRQSFTAMIEAIVQGDDVLMSMNDKIRTYFTPDGIKQCMRERGYVVTSDDKSRDIGFASLSEASFLKRGFNLEHGTVHGNLSLETIVNTPLWSKNGDYYKKITRDSVKFYFRELSLHPIEIFNKYAEPMRRAVVAAKLENFEGLTWDHSTWRASVYDSEPFTMDF